MQSITEQERIYFMLKAYYRNMPSPNYEDVLYLINQFAILCEVVLNNDDIEFILNKFQDFYTIRY